LRKNILCLVAFLQTLVLSTNLPASQCLAYTIEGKIEHQEALPKVESAVRKGAKYRVGVNDFEAANNWVQVPAWLSGTWIVHEETAVLRHDFKTGQIDRHPTTFITTQEFTYGNQKDRQGNIWHYIGVPYTSKTRMATTEDFHEVKEKDFLVATEKQVQFRSVVTVVRVSHLSGRVAQSFQQESITGYKPVSDGVIQLTASTKTFDSDGNAVYQQDNQARIKRYKHYADVDNKDGKNLKELFIQYLTAKGLTNLLP